MSRFSALLLVSVLLVPLHALAWTARPEHVLPHGLEEDLRWQPQAIAAPVNPSSVSGLAPYVSMGNVTRQGEATLASGEAAAFWLRPLEVVRVSTEARVRFVRIPEIHAGESEVRLDESGIAARKNEWYLAEPPGRGSVWLVIAEEKADIDVARPEERRDALAGEAIRAHILAWIDGRGPRPPLTFLAQLRSELELAAELERVLVEANPALAPAARAWRKASALQALARWQPLRSGTWRRREISVPGERVKLSADAAASYVRLKGAEGTQTLELTGPGVLSLRLRPIIAEGTSAPRRLSISEGDRLLLEETLLPQPAWEREESVAAFPHLATPRLLPTGERLGIASELRINLREGRHTYRLSWTGGGLLVRGEAADRKAWTLEVLRGTGSFSGWAQEAWSKLGSDRSAAAQLLRSWLFELEPGVAKAQPELVQAASGTVLSALVGVEESRRGKGLKALEKTLATLDGSALRSTPLLAWELRLRTAKALLEASETARAQRVLSRATAFPESGWLAARAAELINALPRGVPLRSRELAALELAWRKEPLSEEIRTRYRLAWSRASRWKLLGPDRFDEEVPAPQRWIDLTELDPGESGGAGVLHRLEAGRTVKLSSTEAVPRLLRAYLVFEEAAKASAILRVGGRTFRFEPFSRVEPVELALPQGTHEVSLEAGAGVYAFLSDVKGNPDGDARVAYLHTHWPLRSDGAPVRYRVPDARLPSPVRLSLRAEQRSSEPIELWMHTDVAPPRRLVLHPSSVNERHFDLQKGERASSPATVVTWLPPLAQEVWFTSAKGKASKAVAALSVRQDEFVETAQAADVGALTPERLAKLHAISLSLKNAPSEVELLLDRAELLLDASEGWLARADLARLLDHQETLDAAPALRLSQLLERVANQGDSLSFTTPLTGPTLLFPGGGAWKDDTEAERYRQARSLLTSGRAEEGVLLLAELYRTSRRPALGLEALSRMEALLSADSATRKRLAPIAKALALELSAWGDVPSLRRVSRLALGSARWERLQSTQRAAGAVLALQSRAALTPREALKKALLATPWPLQEGRLLSAGDAMVLALEARGEGPVTFETLCDSLTRAVDRCEWRVRLDGRIVEERSSAPGETVTLDVPLTRGAHQVELMLGRSRAVGLVRYRLAADTLTRRAEAVVPLMLTRSRAETPAVLEVFGPAAVRIRARAVSPAPGRSLSIAWRSLKGEGAPETVGLPLPEALDATVVAERFAAGAEAETTLLLTAHGPHELRLTPSEGEALLQVDLGVEADAPKATPTLWAEAPTGVEPLPWPAMPAPLSLLPTGRRGGWGGEGLGTLSPELAVRAEELGEGELLGRPPRSGLELRLGLRRELSEDAVWLKLQPRLRMPETMSPVVGLDAALFLAKLPGRFRTQLSAATSAQRIDGALRSSVKGSLFLDRPFRLNPDWVLYPGATLTAESFQGTGGDADEFDRDVLWRWGQDHARRVSPSLSLRWTPLQDQLGRIGVSATSNADLQTLDHVTGRIGWGSLFGGSLGVVRAELGYEASWRFEDAHRSQSYLRHGVAAHADWALWNFASSRLLFFAEDRVLWSAPLGLQNVFSLGVRWDFSGGRGMRDLLPFEEEFEQLLDPARSID